MFPVALKKYANPLRESVKYYFADFVRKVVFDTLSLTGITDKFELWMMILRLMLRMNLMGLLQVRLAESPSSDVAEDLDKSNTSR